MIDVNDTKNNAHVPHFLKPRHGNAVSIEIRNARDLYFSEKWCAVHGYFDAEAATGAEVKEYISQGIVEPHDAEAWDDFNDFALAA